MGGGVVPLELKFQAVVKLLEEQCTLITHEQSVSLSSPFLPRPPE